MKLLILLLVLFALYFVVAAGMAILGGWMNVKKIPREKDMYWCTKHGQFSKKHCLHLFPGMTTQKGEPFLCCPICYRETVFDNVDARAKQ